MTVLMTFVGAVVFVFSIFTVGFKAAFWRLLAFTLVGVMIDALLIGIAVTIAHCSI
jgi:hypothetical protein